MKFFVLAFLVLILAGCTDAAWDREVVAYGESFDVVCYSGGQEIFTAKTTGKVSNMEGGGWAFRTTDGRFVQTFADCFVSFKK